MIMKIDILTLFPSMFQGPFDTSMLKKAQDNNLVEINIHDLRQWSTDKHKTTDDRPYGGGPGMVLMVEPIYNALNVLKKESSKIILLTPQGKKYDQKETKKFSKFKHIMLIAGHYEGFDERIREHLVDYEISIGDYVLTGGELPAMVIVDSIVRLLPGVLEHDAKNNESFENNLLDHPQYTRPENFNDWNVPEILLSGNHAEITKWRQTKAIEKTKKQRPDLIK